MSGVAARIKFLNVDLDVRGTNDQLPLVEACDGALIVMHHEQGHFASFEVTATLETPAQCSAAFLDVLEQLPSPAKQAWAAADVRAFNIGVQAADEPHSVVCDLPAALMQRCAAIGAAIEVTIDGGGARRAEIEPMIVVGPGLRRDDE